MSPDQEDLITRLVLMESTRPTHRSHDAIDALLTEAAAELRSAREKVDEAQADEMRAIVREVAERLAREKSDARALSAEAEVLRLRGVLEPFAKFRLEGFDGEEVLEVVPSSPDNPARRIEPIFTTYFRAARSALALPSLGGGDRASLVSTDMSAPSAPSADSEGL